MNFLAWNFPCILEHWIWKLFYIVVYYTIIGGKITKKETAAEEKSVKAKNTASKAASKTSETAGTEKTVGAEKSDGQTEPPQAASLSWYYRNN